MGHQDNLLDKTIDTGEEMILDPIANLEAVMEDLESLLKSGEVIGALTNRGINASIAMLAASGLRAYLEGNKADAADDLLTAGEEIRGRAAGGKQA